MQSTGSAFPIVERQSQIAGRAPDRRAGRRRRATAMRAETVARRTRSRRALGRARPAGDARGLRHVHARARRASSRPDARGRGVSRRGARHRRERRVRHRGPRRAARARAGTSRGSTCAPTTTEVIACDITDPAAVPGAVAEAVERLGGGLDVLSTTPGIGGPASAGAAAGRPRAEDARRQPARRLGGDRRGDRRARRVAAAASCCSARGWRSSGCRWAPPTACRSAR